MTESNESNSGYHTTEDGPSFVPSSSEDGEHHSKKKSRKKLVVIGLAIILLGVVCVGGWAWHEQPSFCSAICHDVMSPYVEGYESGDQKLLITAHTEESTCISCHEPTVEQQIGELQAYISGDYKTPLKARKIGTKQFCSSCHGGYDDLSKLTEDYDETYNPHESHNGEMDCYSCHSMHRESTLYCSSCHGDMPKPTGWK